MAIFPGPHSTAGFSMQYESRPLWVKNPLSHESRNGPLLDENRGYCLDIKGYKTNADPTRGLQAHTCYSYQGRIAVDQGFDIDRMNSGQFYLPGFEVCIELSPQNDTYEIKLSACDLSNNAQNLKLTDKGEITFANDPSLCLTASDKESREGGGGEPVHLIRDLSIISCDDQKKVYQRWGLRSSN